MDLDGVMLSEISYIEKDRGFPGDPVVKNLPANARNAGDVG